MSTNDEAEAREAAAEEDILAKRLEKDRYAIQTGAAGTWNILRLVNPGCPDYEEGPYEEYYCSVCICASPSTAAKIAESLEDKYPDGDIV